MTPPIDATAKKAHAVGSEKPFEVTTGSLPGSQKIYAKGSERLQGVNVAMRAISLSPKSGEVPVVVYDPSGPYTDSNEKVDIAKGLSPIRAEWIGARNDTESYEGRPVRPEDNGYKEYQKIEVMQFPRSDRKPRRAKAGGNVTQMRGSPKVLNNPKQKKTETGEEKEG